MSGNDTRAHRERAGWLVLRLAAVALPGNPGALVGAPALHYGVRMTPAAFRWHVRALHEVIGAAQRDLEHVRRPAVGRAAEPRVPHAAACPCTVSAHTPAGVRTLRARHCIASRSFPRHGSRPKMGAFQA